MIIVTGDCELVLAKCHHCRPPLPIFTHSMFPRSTRKILAAIGGIILGLLITLETLPNVSSMPSSTVSQRESIVWLGALIGALCGLIFESWVANRYETGKEEHISVRASESSMAKSARYGYIASALYLLIRIWGMYAYARNGLLLSASPVFARDLVFSGALCLLFIFLWNKQGKHNLSSSVEKAFAKIALVFFLLVILDVVAIMMR